MSNLNKQFMFLLMKYVPGGRLPKAYREVEYLESTRLQYIDLNFIANGNTHIYVDFEGVGPFIGSFITGRRVSVLSGLFGLNIGNDKYFGAGYGGQRNQTIALYDNNRHIYELNKNNVYLDNELKHTFTSAGLSSSLNQYLFAVNEQGTADLFAKIKCYSFKAWDDNDNLIRNLVPCYRKSDYKPGMYDLVNNVFYVNQGTSEDFILGPNV